MTRKHLFQYASCSILPYKALLSLPESPLFYPFCQNIEITDFVKVRYFCWKSEKRRGPLIGPGIVFYCQLISVVQFLKDFIFKQGAKEVFLYRMILFKIIRRKEKFLKELRKSKPSVQGTTGLSFHRFEEFHRPKLELRSHFQLLLPDYQ